MIPTVSERTAAPRGDGRAGSVLRTDIQGLRALAVTMVLLYHLWPNRLTGGFTGVDVFFVISGFLITSHLLAHAPTNARDLVSFWSRRVRRLLPAALLVLATTLAATRIIAPDTAWGNTASQVKAAALYVVNWRLADDSVDYLASHNAPTPVQHFWSLSVEEQFYLVWPVLILILVAVARWTRRRAMPIVAGGLAIVVAGSFAFSLYETHAEPARAYFVTPTRIWELGVGGLLAALLSRRALGRNSDNEAIPLGVTSRVVLAWAGLAVIAWTAFEYTGATPFPSWQAAVPVLGTAAVIAACAPGIAGSPGPLMAARPIQWLGGVSYSVYLWHWPLIVLVPFLSGDRLGLLDKIGIIAASLLLAGLTKRFVEDRFRAPKWGRPLWKPFLLAAIGMALVVGGATAQGREVHDRAVQAAANAKRILATSGRCLGAAALAAPHGQCPRTIKAPVVPEPLEAARDKSDAYSDVSGTSDCFSHGPNFPVVTCTRGDTSARVRVALVGNSHAGEWLPALEQIAGQSKWRITTYLASDCALSHTRQHFEPASVTDACLNWVNQVTKTIIAGHYDLVVMTNKVSVTAVGHDLAGSYAPYGKGYTEVLRRFQAAHVHVIGIHDTPSPGTVVIPDCLAAHPSDYTPCNGTRSKWVPPEPMGKAVAAIRDPHITEVDMTKYFCYRDTCPAAIGDVVVYSDNSHMTATYARTVAPYLAPALRAAMRG